MPAGISAGRALPSAAAGLAPLGNGTSSVFGRRLNERTAGGQLGQGRRVAHGAGQVKQRRLSLAEENAAPVGAEQLGRGLQQALGERGRIDQLLDRPAKLLQSTVQLRFIAIE